MRRLGLKVPRVGFPNGSLDPLLPTSSRFMCTCLLQGSHEVAAAIYANLRAHVASEHLYFWLNGLQELAQGEQALMNLSGEPPANCLSCLAEALVRCQRGMASLTVCQPLLFNTCHDEFAFFWFLTVII